MTLPRQVNRGLGQDGPVQVAKLQPELGDGVLQVHNRNTGIDLGFCDHFHRRHKPVGLRNAVADAGQSDRASEKNDSPRAY